MHAACAGGPTAKGGHVQIRCRAWAAPLLVLLGATILAVVSPVTSNAQEAAPSLVRDDHPQFGGWITAVEVAGIGRIAVHIQEPTAPRYEEGAPVIVNVSGFFTASSGFAFEWEPDALGVIYVTYLWPGKTDARTGVSSEGTYDYGGPDCLTALRDVVRFATGEIPNVDGQNLDDLVDVYPLVDICGVYAFSHSGVAATNVLALHGESLQRVNFFIGRENPTMDALYPLEPGYWDDAGNAVVNPFYDPAGYTPTSISIDYSTAYWSEEHGCPAFRSTTPGMPDYVCSTKHPRIWDKDIWSTALLQALLDNGSLTREAWPDGLATPEEAAEAWTFRSTVNNYTRFVTGLSDLNVMLVFAADDHVQTALDKPHIHHAYDGFRGTAGLWCRLNPDRAYVETFATTGVSVPEHPANREPLTWSSIRRWGTPSVPGLNLQVVLASIAEMCDRTYYDVWIDDLPEVLHVFDPATTLQGGPVIVRFPDGTSVSACSLASRREENPDRDYGLYLDAAWAPTWDADVIDWPDFGTPANADEAAAQIESAFARAQRGERVEVGCIGGIGRTGTVLACMAVLAGVRPIDAVEWIRDHYHPSAVETDDQSAWVLWFGERSA